MLSLLVDVQTAAPGPRLSATLPGSRFTFKKGRAEYSGNSAETCCQTAVPEAEESRLAKDCACRLRATRWICSRRPLRNVGGKRPSSRERGWGIRTHVHLLPLFYSGLKLSSSKASPSSIRDVGIAP